MAAGQLNDLKIGFVIQARMQSTRLPGKILMPIPFNSNNSTLDWIINQLKKIDFCKKSIYIATSIREENDVLEQYCADKKIKCFRGNEDDVLSRFIEIGSREKFDHVVRLTGDNPIIDLGILEKAIFEHESSGVDYTYTTGLPLGMNLEIISNEKIVDLNKQDLPKEDREHVTSYIRSHSNYKKQLLKPLGEKDRSHIRLTIDYPSDFLVLSAVLAIAISNEIDPGIELINFCTKEYQWIFDLNRENFQKVQFNSLSEEIIVAKPILEKLEMHRLLNKLQIIE